MLTRLFVDNFKTLSNFEFRPEAVNLIVGANGAGKSSLSLALALLRQLLLGEQVASLFAGTKTAWDARDVQTFQIVATIQEKSYRYDCRIKHSLASAAAIDREELSCDGRPLLLYENGQVTLFADDHSPSATLPFAPAHSPVSSFAAAGPKVASFTDFVTGIWIFNLNPYAMESLSNGDSPFLRRDGKNLGDWIRTLFQESPKAAVGMNEALGEAIQGFRELSLKSLGDGRRLLRTRFTTGNDTYELPFFELSEGERCLVALYSIVFGVPGRASLIVIDEPENFVGVRALGPWLRHLRELDGTPQTMVISHHLDVIDYLAADATFRFSRGGSGACTVERVSYDRSQGIPASEQYRLLEAG